MRVSDGRSERDTHTPGGGSFGLNSGDSQPSMPVGPVKAPPLPHVFLRRGGDGSGPVSDSAGRDIVDDAKTTSDHKKCTGPSSIREDNNKLIPLTDSVRSLESSLQKFPAYEVRNAQQWALQWIPKAIVVCDALEVSLAGPPEEPLTESPGEPGEPEKKLMMRGELSARVLQKLPWESLGVILGLDRDHPSLLELSSKIGDFIKAVETGGTSQALTETWEDAVEAVRELRAQLESVASILASLEADNVAEVALDRRAPLEAAGSLSESALRIGTTVLVGSMFCAPLGAAIFHEPLLSAGVKVGITSLIGSTTAELVNHEIKSGKQHRPEAAFRRCHDHLLMSLDDYSALTSGACREELVVARAHLVTDAYAVRLATIRLDWPAKDQYWATIEGLQKEIDHGEEPQRLTVWRSRLSRLAQSLENKNNLKVRGGITSMNRVEPEKEPLVTQAIENDANEPEYHTYEHAPDDDSAGTGPRTDNSDEDHQGWNPQEFPPGLPGAFGMGAQTKDGGPSEHGKQISREHPEIGRDDPGDLDY
jgi:hypothetical protein